MRSTHHSVVLAVQACAALVPSLSHSRTHDSELGSTYSERKTRDRRECFLSDSLAMVVERERCRCGRRAFVTAERPGSGPHGLVPPGIQCRACTVPRPRARCRACPRVDRRAHQRLGPMIAFTPRFAHTYTTPGQQLLAEEPHDPPSTVVRGMELVTSQLSGPSVWG